MASGGSSSSGGVPAQPPAASRLHRLWRWIHPDLAGVLRDLDDDQLARLGDSILRNPRGIKGVHLRMVRNEIARRV